MYPEMARMADLLCFYPHLLLMSLPMLKIYTFHIKFFKCNEVDVNIAFVHFTITPLRSEPSPGILAHVFLIQCNSIF